MSSSTRTSWRVCSPPAWRNCRLWYWWCLWEWVGDVSDGRGSQWGLYSSASIPDSTCEWPRSGIHKVVIVWMDGGANCNCFLSDCDHLFWVCGGSIEGIFMSMDWSFLANRSVGVWSRDWACGRGYLFVSALPSCEKIWNYRSDWVNDVYLIKSI